MMHDVVGNQRNVVDVIDVSDDDDQCDNKTNFLSSQLVNGIDSFYSIGSPHQESIRLTQEQTYPSKIPSAKILSQEDEVQITKNFNTIHHDQQMLNKNCVSNGLSQEFVKNKRSQEFVHQNSELHLEDMSQLIEEDEFSNVKQKSLGKEQLINADILMHEHMHLKDDMGCVQSARSGCNEVVIINRVDHESGLNEPSEQLILPHSVKVHAVSHRHLLEKFSRVGHKAVRTKQIPSILRRSTHPNTLVQKNLETESMGSNEVGTPMLNEIITSTSPNERYDANETTKPPSSSVIQECVKHVDSVEETLDQFEYEPVRKKQKTKPKLVRLRKITSILDLKREVAELRRSIITLEANQKQEVRSEVCRVLQSIFSPEIVRNLLDQEALTSGMR